VAPQSLRRPQLNLHDRRTHPLPHSQIQRQLPRPRSLRRPALSRILPRPLNQVNTSPMVQIEVRSDNTILHSLGSLSPSPLEIRNALGQG
jgi:hypothetical protein